MSQEDAHNAILDFDEKTSLFAVYDGHGGAEIALYCSRYLPDFLKKLDSYRDGRFEDALKEGFLQFDSLLLESNVKKVLQKIANAENDDEGDGQSHDIALPTKSTSEKHHDDEFNREEAQLLKQEAELPIEELRKRYNDQEERADSWAKVDESGEAEKKAISTTDPEQHESKKTTTSDSHPDSTEAKPSSSAAKSGPRRPRKPVSTDTASPLSTTITSNSLTRHLLSDNLDDAENDDDDDDDDEDDFEFDASEEDTSGDEAEDHNDDDDDEEENEEDKEGDNDENQPMDPSKVAQVQKLMRKSIMALLNQRAKKRRTAAAQGDDGHASENPNEEDESDDDEDQEEEDDDEEEEEEAMDDEDLGMLDMQNEPGSSSGCTAVVALLRDMHLFVANAGDSRCVVCRAQRAIEMSVDHKPEDAEERQRIEKAGYKVTADGRVSGGLNLSRAIGDHAYKKTIALPCEEQAITALPDIRTLKLEAEDEFMVIACDGIWNFMSSQDVVDFVHYRLEKKSPAQICEELFMHCLAPNTSGDGTGCDNMTAIIVRFNFNRTSTDQESSAMKSASTTSINPKRPLSPDHLSTLETADSTNSKKFKILAENGSNEMSSSKKASESLSISSSIHSNNKEEQTTL